MIEKRKFLALLFAIFLIPFFNLGTSSSLSYDSVSLGPPWDFNYSYANKETKTPLTKSDAVATSDEYSGHVFAKSVAALGGAESLATVMHGETYTAPVTGTYKIEYEYVVSGGANIFGATPKAIALGAHAALIGVLKERLQRITVETVSSMIAEKIWGSIGIETNAGINVALQFVFGDKIPSERTIYVKEPSAWPIKWSLDDITTIVKDSFTIDLEAGKTYQFYAVLSAWSGNASLDEATMSVVNANGYLTKVLIQPPDVPPPVNPQKTNILTFTVNPPEAGEISFLNSKVKNGDTNPVEKTTYEVRASAIVSDMEFLWWSTKGDIKIINVKDNPAIVSIDGSGEVRAIFKARLKFLTDPPNVGTIWYMGSEYDKISRSSGDSLWENCLLPIYACPRTIKAEIPSGYEFSNWKVENGNVVPYSLTTQYTDIAVGGPDTITAVFKKIEESEQPSTQQPTLPESPPPPQETITTESKSSTLDLYYLPEFLPRDTHITFSGVLTSDNGSPISNASIKIVAVSGDSNDVISTVTTDQNGFYHTDSSSTILEKYGNTSRLHAVFDGNSQYYESSSKSYSIILQQKELESTTEEQSQETRESQKELESITESEEETQSIQEEELLEPIQKPILTGTEISLDPLPTSIQRGEKITFSGRLTTSYGNPISDANVRIKLMGGGEYKEINIRTNSDGYYKLTTGTTSYDEFVGGFSGSFTATASFPGNSIYQQTSSGDAYTVDMIESQQSASQGPLTIKLHDVKNQNVQQGDIVDIRYIVGNPTSVFFQVVREEVMLRNSETGSIIILSANEGYSKEPGKWSSKTSFKIDDIIPIGNYDYGVSIWYDEFALPDVAPSNPQEKFNVSEWKINAIHVVEGEKLESEVLSDTIQEDKSAEETKSLTEKKSPISVPTTQIIYPVEDNIVTCGLNCYTERITTTPPKEPIFTYGLTSCQNTPFFLKFDISKFSGFNGEGTLRLHIAKEGSNTYDPSFVNFRAVQTTNNWDEKTITFDTQNTELSNSIEVSNPGISKNAPYDVLIPLKNISTEDGVFSVKIHDTLSRTCDDWVMIETVDSSNVKNRPYLKFIAAPLELPSVEAYVETKSDAMPESKEVSPQQIQTPVSDGGGCLIATAAFGSELAPQVQMLRETRDNIVMQTQSGAAFMTAFNSVYYSFAPTVAEWERQNPVFKEMVKVTITPLITTLSILNYVDIDSEAEMLGYGIGVILLNIGMYFVAPAFVIIRIKQHKK